MCTFDTACFETSSLLNQSMEQQPRKDMQSSLERPLVFRNWKKALLAFGAEFLLSEGSLVRYGMDPGRRLLITFLEMYHHLNVTATMNYSHS